MKSGTGYRKFRTVKHRETAVRNSERNVQERRAEREGGMREEILSVGIDIGTSTTQLIFSRLVIKNLAGSYAVPRIEIAEKEVIYRSGIYDTPLRSPTEIDAEAVRKIVESEYEKAGIKPEELQTGAVIITGETARKQNASRVLELLSGMAGDFVAATAGPDLESVLSARGAGTDRLSEERRETAVNIDIGGGTSNLALFQKGTLRGTSCLDIGGRLIKVREGRIVYVFPAIGELAAEHGIVLKEGGPADEAELFRVCELMADQLAMAVHLKPADSFHKRLYTNGGKPLPKEPPMTAVTFSGGVAECMRRTEAQDPFRYGDVGPLLAKAIREHKAFRVVHQYEARETIRATVVGAGTHTTSVSGSTITCAEDTLPIKNLPVVRIGREAEQTRELFINALRSGMALFEENGRQEPAAIAFSGEFHTGFREIQELASWITEGADKILAGGDPLILVLEQDIAKALGNALKVRLNGEHEVICIDGIHVSDGDYIDIGEPAAGGRLVPVVIKTLIFNS